jgi:two-component system osmolarity sensor histidine kinase EnvZ
VAAPTLFRRLVIAQAAAAVAVVVVFSAAFYVERNRTIARLTAERWSPALRGAAGLPEPPADPASPAAPPRADAVHVRDDRPPDAIPGRAWAPRVVALRETLRESGVPVQDVVFTAGRPHASTWVQVRVAGGRTRWLGFDEDVIESHVLRRLAVAMTLAVALLGWGCWILARRIARPLESLRARMQAHGARPGPAVAVPPVPVAADPSATAEIAAMESAWRALVERLDRQESERALLLAGVSHDLRGPLARIRMAAELLPESADVAARRTAIVRNVEVADRLIDSFLDYVRASELPLDATVDVAALARRLAALRGDPAGQLAIEAPAQLPVPRASELLLERLIGNLVDNAMRHGRPPVRVRIAARDGDVVIEVEDHGPGIAIAERARLTQAFARGDDSRRTPGTGLGLAVVQQIARRMGGSLSFESGTDLACVQVRLPSS